MDLTSLDALRKQRRKLVKGLEAPLDFANDLERQRFAAINTVLRKLIADIDTEVRERTGLQDIGENST